MAAAVPAAVAAQEVLLAEVAAAVGTAVWAQALRCGSPAAVAPPVAAGLASADEALSHPDDAEPSLPVEAAQGREELDEPSPEWQAAMEHPHSAQACGKADWVPVDEAALPPAAAERRSMVGEVQEWLSGESADPAWPDSRTGSPGALADLLPQAGLGHWNSKSAAEYVPADFPVERDSPEGPCRVADLSGFRPERDCPVPAPVPDRHAGAESWWDEADYGLRPADAVRHPAEPCWEATDAVELVEVLHRVLPALPVLHGSGVWGVSGRREHC